MCTRDLFCVSRSSKSLRTCTKKHRCVHVVISASGTNFHVLFDLILTSRSKRELLSPCVLPYPSSFPQSLVCPSPSIFSLCPDVGISNFSFCCSCCYVATWSVLCSSSSTSLDSVYPKKGIERSMMEWRKTGNKIHTLIYEMWVKNISPYESWRGLDGSIAKKVSLHQGWAQKQISVFAHLPFLNMSVGGKNIFII